MDTSPVPARELRIGTAPNEYPHLFCEQLTKAQRVEIWDKYFHERIVQGVFVTVGKAVEAAKEALLDLDMVDATREQAMERAMERAVKKCARLNTLVADINTDLKSFGRALTHDYKIPTPSFYAIALSRMCAPTKTLTTLSQQMADHMCAIQSPFQMPGPVCACTLIGHAIHLSNDVDAQHEVVDELKTSLMIWGERAREALGRE